MFLGVIHVRYFNPHIDRKSSEITETLLCLVSARLQSGHYCPLNIIMTYYKLGSDNTNVDALLETEQKNGKVSDFVYLLEVLNNIIMLS